MVKEKMEAVGVFADTHVSVIVIPINILLYC